MPKLAEQLAATSAKLDALLPTETVVEKYLELTPVDAAKHVAEELAKDDVSKERRQYLATVLADLAKVNSEGTNTSIKIKVIDDPLQIKPGTAAIAPLQSLASSKPDSHFSYNLKTSLHKAELMQKFLLAPDKIREGKIPSDATEVAKMFELSAEDLKAQCALTWTVGDIVAQLAKAAKEVESQPLEKSADQSSSAWPADMANAKFDPVTKAYKKEDLRWGDDSVSRR